jgi:hypothetical protein
MSLHCIIHDSFSEIKSQWLEFLPEQHHLVSDDVLAIENSHLSDIQVKYIDLYKDNVWIGVAYLQCLNFNTKHYKNKTFEHPLFEPIKNCLIGRKVQFLICGNLFRVKFQGFYFKDKVQRPLIFDYLSILKKQLNQNGSYCGILLKDCSRTFTTEQCSLTAFKPFRNDLTMELVLREWHTFEDYCQDLTRKYRQRAFKIRKALEGIEVRELGLEEINQYADRLIELYQNIVKEQSITLGVLNAQYFVQMKALKPNNFRVYGYFRANELVAFSSQIDYPAKNSMEIHYIGLDYQYNQTHQLYFNILFDGICCAMQRGYKKLEMGRTAKEAKANTGATAIENFNYIWIKPGILRVVFYFLNQWYAQNIGDNWQERHPFKANQDTKPILIEA